MTDAERAELDAVAGMPVRHLVRDLVDAVDPDTTRASSIVESWQQHPSSSDEITAGFP